MEQKRNNNNQRTNRGPRKPRKKQIFNRNGIPMDTDRPARQFRKPDIDE